MTGSPRIVLAGSVGSSRRTLQALTRHNSDVVGVLGLAVEDSQNVSGYERLDVIARAAGIPYRDFQKINDPAVLSTVRAWKPDLLFVVGLSQMVKPELLAVPSKAAVGFHPTMLPENRGRAPIAWLILETVGGKTRTGAATFFVMEKEPDSGPILAQVPFNVTPHDYAADVYRKMESAIDAALDQWLPRLIAGEWDPKPQDDSRATYRGARRPEDGLIDWTCSADEIHALVRAASRPHPGAYTFVEGKKLIIWCAEKEAPVKGDATPGVIVSHEPAGFRVQAGGGSIVLTEIEQPADAGKASSPVLRVGVLLVVER